MNRIVTRPLGSDEYIAHGACVCPVCGSDDLEGVGSWEGDGTWVSKEIECTSCKSTWTDIYEITGYVSLEVNRGDKI